MVLNHRMGGDAAETARATPFRRTTGCGPGRRREDIEAYTHFRFPGRQGRYSGFEWHARHFDAVDYNALRPDEKNTVYLLEGKAFDDQVALENGNFSFLMGCDLDFQSQEVRDEVTAWGKWYLDTTGVDGFRLDAVKHIAAWFFPEWLDAMEKHAGKDLFVVGEYWTPDVGALHWYLDRLGGRLCVFDVPLHYAFHYAGQGGARYDMRKILEGTLARVRPTQVVTFVDNHDSQPLQALESPVAPWFKPLAYAIILLRREGYPVPLLSRLLRGRVRGLRPGRPAPPGDPALAPLPHRPLPARAPDLRRTGRSTTTSTTRTAWAGPGSATRSTRRPWPCS